MPSPPGNNDPAALQKVAEHVKEILARRTQRHVTRAAALAAHLSPLSIRTEITPATPAAPTSTTSQTAGYLIAVGDSWFDYPIFDILTKLDDNYGYSTESSAHAGDPVEKMVSSVGQLDQFSRNLDKIASLGASPKAVLISGGGDDIAGKEFGMLINNVDLTISGWNDEVLAGVIDTRIATAYRMLITKINALCQSQFNRTFPILMHGYSYPVPDGRGFLGGGLLPGPWLKPGFDEKLFTDLTQTTHMMVQIIDRFNVMLQGLAADPSLGTIHYIDLRKTLSNALDDYTTFWANELHPTGGGPLTGILGQQDGFRLVADQFQAVLSKLP